MALVNTATRFGLRRVFLPRAAPGNGGRGAGPARRLPAPPGVPVAKQRVAPAASSKDGAWAASARELPRPTPGPTEQAGHALSRHGAGMASGAR